MLDLPGVTLRETGSCGKHVEGSFRERETPNDEGNLLRPHSRRWTNRTD